MIGSCSFYSWRTIACIVLLFPTLALLTGCTAMKSAKLGIHNGQLAPCPSSPNCVSSDADDPGHRVQPYNLRMEPERAWHILRETVAALPRTRIKKATDTYLHAEARSRFFRFVDDLEFNLRPTEGIIAVRSASRTGYYDLGVNRERVEHIRNLLRDQDVIE